MKKNILTILIMALTAINVIMTAVMLFVMLPTFQKTNNIITQVASVLNLELEADAENGEGEKYSIDDVEDYDVAFEKDETINLPMGADGNTHYAMLSGFTLRMNKSSGDYKKLSKTLENQQSAVQNIIISVISSHSMEDITREKVEQEALEEIQEYFDSKFIVGISLAGFMYS